MLYAKSNPEESITQHTQELLKNLEILKETYGEEVQNNQTFEKERFWELLKMICTYHDIGKVYTPFQNEIRKNIGLEPIKTEFNYKEMKHEQLSPLFIPTMKYELTKEEKKIVYQAIFYHHEREKSEISEELVQKIIEKDILPRINELGELLYENFQKVFNIKEMLDDGISKVIVYENDEKIIGFISATYLYDTCDILSLVVDPMYRGQLVASNLLTYLIGDLGETLKLVTLEVASKNKAAIKLYEKFGFEVVNKRKKYYKNDDAYLMARKW